MPRQEESNVGSGNPYYGSGFTNFDRYLQQSNIDWGAQQAEPVQDSNDWSMKTGFDNWMIGAGKPQRDAEEAAKPVTPENPNPNTDFAFTRPTRLDEAEPNVPSKLDDKKNDRFPRFNNYLGEVW